MISSEMVNCLQANLDLLDEAYKERAKGNEYGACWLAEQYRQNIQQELDFWHVDYNWALKMGLVESSFR